MWSHCERHSRAIRSLAGSASSTPGRSTKMAPVNKTGDWHKSSTYSMAAHRAADSIADADWMKGAIFFENVSASFAVMTWFLPRYWVISLTIWAFNPKYYISLTHLDHLQWYLAQTWMLYPRQWFADTKPESNYDLMVSCRTTWSKFHLPLPKQLYGHLVSMSQHPQSLASMSRSRSPGIPWNRNALLLCIECQAHVLRGLKAR